MRTHETQKELGSQSSGEGKASKTKRNASDLRESKREEGRVFLEFSAGNKGRRREMIVMSCNTLLRMFMKFSGLLMTTPESSSNP